MSTFFTADWHLSETRLEIMSRDIFASPEHMNESLINLHNINSKVKKNDEVYVIGDVIFRDANVEETLPLIERFNGRKILIRGNHDRHITDEQFSPFFEEIIPEGEGIEMMIGDITCYLTHYPTRGKKFKYNLVGHIHGAWKHQLNMLNVGVDVHHFCPVNEKFVSKYFTAITEYYDEDVWVAYNEINSRYRNNRGKKGTYFP